MAASYIHAEMRQCKACLEVFPLNEDNFYKSSRQTAGRPTLFEGRCKTCFVAQVKDRMQTEEARLKRSEWMASEPARNSKALREKQYRNENPDGYRDSKLRSMFNISLLEYRVMLESQGGVCKICGSYPKANKALGVDHDHSCCPGKKSCGACVRGLLCDPCNQAIGLLGDNRARMQSAIEYLDGGWR